MGSPYPIEKKNQILGRELLPIGLKFLSSITKVTQCKSIRFTVKPITSVH